MGGCDILTLAVTGGIGSGKSAVCRILGSRGVPVYDSDSRTKAMYDTDKALVDKMEAALCTELRDAGGRLDRKKLASVVFSDPSSLADLEKVVHPYVLADFIRWRKKCAEHIASGMIQWHPEAGPSPFVIIESAIILEKPLFRNVADKVLVVEAPQRLRLERAMKRDNVPAALISERMERQETFRRCDFPSAIVLDNDGDIDTLEIKVSAMLKTLWT